MIKKRNLDAALIQWIMSETGLGPIIGTINYVAPTAAATSQFRTQLEDMGINSGSIHTTLAAAYAKTVTRRNDIIIIAPGIYTVTTELAQAKDNVHMIGSNAGLPHGDWTLTSGCPVFTTATVTQANILNLTGERNTFRNIIFENYGANAACLNAVTVNGYGNSFYNCGIQGIMAATQVDTAAACSLNIAAGGYYSYFEDCLIGSAEWAVRTSTTQGQLRFTGTTGGGPAHGHFHNCVFRSISATAGVPMVYIVGNVGAGRSWRYTDCLFYNFASDYTAMTAVFSAPAGSMNVSTHILERCTAVGYTEWQVRDFAGWVVGAMGTTADGGGLAELMDEAVEH